MRFSRTFAKWAAYGIALVLGLALLGSFLGESEPDGTDQTKSDAKPVQTVTAEAEEGLEASIRQAVRQSSSVDEIISIEVIDSATEPGKRVVHVAFKVSKNLTKSLTKAGIETAMWAGYRAAYTVPEPVSLATMEAWMILIDKHGKESLGFVYGTRLDQATASKVNWQNRNVIDPTKIWQTYWLNRSLR